MRQIQSLILSVLTASVLAACAGATKSSEVVESNPASEIIVDTSLPAAEKKIPGRLFAFNELRAGDVVATETLKQIKGAVRKHMLALGYQEAEAPREAFVTIHLYSDRYSATEGEVKASPTLDVAPAVRMARFNLTIFLNEFGKRPRNYSYVTYTSPRTEWTGLDETLLALVTRDFPTLIAKAPEKNLAMKGDPGCYPRFGYQQKDDAIVSVPKGSAAEEAGLQVGDVLESIDSKPVAEALEDTEIYEKRVKVPVRLKRGDQVVRTTIRAKVSCD